MNLQTQKLNIIESLINIEDNEALKKVKEVIAEYSKKKSGKKIKPMTLKEFYAKIDASEIAYKNGKVITGAQLRKEITRWGKK